MRYANIVVCFHLGLSLTVAGCGVIYKSPQIREGVVDGTKVRVIALTPSTTLAANREPYSPRPLPAAFHHSAGISASRLPLTANSATPRQARPVSTLPPEQKVGPYRIGIGDVVLLATKTAPESVAELGGLLAAQTNRQGYTVQDDGAIAIPDVGRVSIADLTLAEAENAVFQRLVERQIDPSFSLEISNFNARKVAIGGAVEKPGVAALTLSPLTLDAAISAVGGLKTLDRETAVIRIYRQGAVYNIAASDFMGNQDYQKIRLMDGDSVYVESDYDLTRAEAYFSEQIALQGARQIDVNLRRFELDEQRSNFEKRINFGAEKREYVYLMGEIGAQSRWALPYEQKASLADAIYDNNGINSRSGDPSQIYVLRAGSDPREFGAVTAWHLDSSQVSGMVLATKFELRPSDVIYVAKQPVSKWDAVITQITPSLITIPLESIGD